MTKGGDMKTSSKIIAAVLVVGAGGAAAAPMITGGIAEERVRTIVGHPRVVQSEYIEWALTDYQQGYLTSQATSEMTFFHPEEDKSFTLVLDHQINHALAAGQSLLSVRTVPRIPQGRPQEIARELFGDREPLVVDYRMRFDGTSVADVTSPSTDGMRELESGAFEWKGLEGRITVSASGGSADYDFTAPGLRVEPNSGDLESASLGSVRMEGAFEESRFDDIWVGAGSFVIDHARASSAEEGDVSINGIELSEEVSLKQDLVEVRLDGRIAEIAGPDNQLRNARLVLSLDRVVPELVQAMQTLSRESAQAGSEEERQRIMRQVIGRVPWDKVAAAEPVFAIETLEADAGEGPIKASGKAGLHAPPQEMQGQVGIGTLPRFAYAELNLRAPQPVVVDAIAQTKTTGTDAVSEEEALRQVQQQLAMLLQQGWIQSGEGDYFASASYDRGTIRINGNSLFGMGGSSGR
jgi:uncharacterized protein YdgA (DUF945 family)